MPTAWSRLNPEAKRKALSAAAGDILALRLREMADGRLPRPRLTRFEVQRRRAERMRAQGKLEPFGQKSSGREPQGVYVIGAQAGAIKIGIACDPARRLKELQTGSPERLRVYAFVEMAAGLARRVERECHSRLAYAHKSGEWFELDWREAVDLVQRVAGNHSAAA